MTFNQNSVIRRNKFDDDDDDEEAQNFSASFSHPRH